MPATRESPTPGAATRPATPPDHFLACPPDHFDAHWLFNGWMHWSERVDRARAAEQWALLVDTLRQAGARVDVLSPEPVSSSLSFTADGAFCLAPGRAVVLSNDGHRGLGEPGVFARWLAAHGHVVEWLPPGRRVDGGNLIRLDDGTVLAGVKAGGDGRAERYLAGVLRLATGTRLVPVALTQTRYSHLDLVVGALGRGRFLVHRAGLADGRLPEALGDADVIEVDARDAASLGCNVVVVGDVVVTGPISPELTRRIERRGLHVAPLDLAEFRKAGGGAKCLTLRLWPDPGGDAVAAR